MSSIGKADSTKSIIIDSSKVKIADTPVKTEKSINISSDKVKVQGFKTGAIPALKGAGVGLLAGVAAGTAISTIVAATGGSDVKGMFVVSGLASIIPAAVAGAVVSQKTDDTGKGALIGAATGGITGALASSVLLIGNNMEGGLILPILGIVGGSIVGAAAGAAASTVTEKK